MLIFTCSTASCQTQLGGLYLTGGAAELMSLFEGWCRRLKVKLILINNFADFLVRSTAQLAMLAALTSPPLTRRLTGYQQGTSLSTQRRAEGFSTGAAACESSQPLMIDGPEPQPTPLTINLNHRWLNIIHVTQGDTQLTTLRVKVTITDINAPKHVIQRKKERKKE